MDVEQSLNRLTFVKKDKKSRFLMEKLQKK